MKHLKRGACAALALILTAGLLSGCGKKNGETQNGGGSSGGETAAEFVYTAEYVPVQGEFTGGLRSMVSAGGYLYAQGTERFETDPPEWQDGDGEVILFDDADAAEPADTADGEAAAASDLAYAVAVPAPGETAYAEPYYEYRPAIYKIGLDGSCEKVPFALDELPEGADGSVNVNNISVADDGTIYILERIYRYWSDAPEDMTEDDPEYWDKYYHSEETYALKVIDGSGAAVGGADLSALSSRPEAADGGNYYYFGINSFAVDGAGNVYVTADEYSDQGDRRQIYVMDRDGAVQFSIPMEEWVQNLMKLSDGTMACAYYADGGQKMAVIDLAAKALGEPTSVKGNLYDMTPGGGDYDFYYTSGINFYGYKAETGESEKLLNWISCNVNPDRSGSTVVLDDGRIVSLSSEWDSSGDTVKNELVILTKVPASSVPQKQVLTLATQYLGYSMRNGIINFNKSSDQYRIEVIDYSEYNTEDDYEAGLTKLRTEMLSGTMPDLLDLNGLSAKQFAARGYLVDLYPYIDADPNLSRDDLVTNVLDTVASDGKLYQTLASFSLITAIGPRSVVGDTPGWTVDEFQAALKEMPEGCTAFDRYVTRDMMLQICLYLDMNSFVDWSTGQCSFDSPAFVKILEFAKSFPSEFDWENYEWSEEDDEQYRIANGLQMLAYTSMGGFDNYTELRMYDALFHGATFIGFPTEYGTGNMFEISASGFAMTSKCSDKDAAWQFLRQFFTEEYQTSDENYFWGFPTNAAAFRKRLDDAMAPRYQLDEYGNPRLDEHGSKIEEEYDTWDWDGVEVSSAPLTREEADRILELIGSTTKVLDYDQSIYDIVQEQAPAFFDGQRSAEDIAKQIQSKATLYVNEQR